MSNDGNAIEVQTVYKIVSRADWTVAQSSGAFAGSADDLRDGFIHLSTGEQLQGTLDRHFAGQKNLMLIAFETRDLADRLRWEPSRGGALFPHYYGALPMAQATSVQELAFGRDGAFEIVAERPKC